MELQKLQKRKNKARNDKNESLLCSSCADLADFYVKEEKFPEAIEEYKIIALIYKKQKKMIEFATVNRGLGDAYLMLNNYEKAIEYQRIYLDLSKEHGNKLEEQRALAALGHTYLTKYLCGNRDKTELKLAEKYFMKSLEVCESLNDVKKFELVDMTARLYNNLGLVKQYNGHHNESITLFNKAITLCKANDVYEALYKAYVSLASFLEKRREFNNALQNYNLAQDTAKKFKNNTSELCDCLSAKAAILLKLGDIQAAKKCYHKAYKLKLPETSKIEIKKKLKNVIILYKTEKEMVSNTNKPMQEYYEKMADGYSTLGCYEKAIEYYEKMLVEAEISGNNLASCYYSLAATYRDAEDYDKAIQFYEKEYLLCEFKKGLDTLCEIADTKEISGCHYTEVVKIYQRGIKQCKDALNQREEGRMLQRLINYLKRTNNLDNITKYEQEFEKTGFVPTDNEESAENSSSDDDDILNNITDVSDDSDSESPRRKRKSFQVRRNVRGETQLHTACINGKLNIVKHLLEQGHPVNIRDNGGWLPLHDACIYGHYEIVQLLLDKGAAISDRGGTHCNGVTPLHDAAINAHLAIVELLLDRGASPLAKTHEGETPYHYLKKAALEVNFDESTRKKHEELLERMKSILDKAGQSTEVNTTIQSSAFILEQEQDFRDRRIRIRRKKEEDEELRHSEDEHEISRKKSLTPKKTEATNEYKMVMENLRRKTPKKNSPELKISSKRSAFLMENELDDDEWLEDDLVETRTKKRKSNLTNDLMFGASTSRKNSSPKFNLDEDNNSRLSDEIFKTYVNDSDDDFEIFGENRKQSPSGSNFQRNLSGNRNRSLSKKSIQPKITHYGNTSPIIFSQKKKSSPKKSPMKRHQSMIIDDDPTLAMDVNIEGRSFRVTTKMSLKNTLTIKWLALEAARRYAKKEYVEPVLELVTESGAELVDDDLIGTLFVTDSQVVEVKGKVLSWNLPHISKRYQDACSDMAISPLDEICQTLDTMTISLDLSQKFYQSKSLEPLCKALLRENRLLEIDFSNNFLSNHCVQLLTNALPTLENLTKLNLSSTNLQTSQIAIISKTLENSSKKILTKLYSLNLSKNFITDENFENLSVLTHNLNLKEINLSFLNFTENIFEKEYNKNVTLDFQNVETLNLSQNNFGNAVLLNILTNLKVDKLRSLDVSNNQIKIGFLKTFINSINDKNFKFNMDYLNLRRCSVEDSEVFNLLRSSDRLECIDLSYTEITSLSLRRLLENSFVKNLTLIGCHNINNYFNDNSNDWNLNDGSMGFKELKITCDPEKFPILIKLWQEKYGLNINIQQENNLLTLKKN